MDVLYPLAAGLVRCIHIDGRHQLAQRIAVQFFNADILVRFLNELLNVFVLSLSQFTRNYTQTTKRGLLTTNKG